MDLIFRIAAIGILVAVLNIVLNKSGKEEISMLTTLAGLIIVLLMVLQEINRLFSTMSCRLPCRAYLPAPSWQWPAPSVKPHRS